MHGGTEMKIRAPCLKKKNLVHDGDAVNAQNMFKQYFYPAW